MGNTVFSLKVSDTVMDAMNQRFYPDSGEIAKALNRKISGILGKSEPWSYVRHGTGSVLEIAKDEALGVTIGVVKKAVKGVCDLYREQEFLSGDVVVLDLSSFVHCPTGLNNAANRGFDPNRRFLGKSLADFGLPDFPDD